MGALWEGPGSAKDVRGANFEGKTGRILRFSFFAFFDLWKVPRGSLERVQAQRKRTGRSQESRLIFFWGPREVRGDPYGLLRGIQRDPEATFLSVAGKSWISSVGIRKPDAGFWGDCGNHCAAAARATPAARSAECGRPGETDKEGFYLKTPSTRRVRRIQSLRAFRRASLRAKP